jgi:Rrf2 family protein
MKITNATDYAIRAILYMAKNQEKKYFMRSELSKECDIPDSFLGKILQALKQAAILTSNRGKFGGYALSKNLENITFYDIIRAVEGEIYINECLNNDKICSKTKECTVKSALSEINNNIIDNLKNYSIKNLILKM